MNAKTDAARCVDVLAYRVDGGDTRYRFVAAGDGSRVVGAHLDEYRKRTRLQYGAVVVLPPFVYAVLLLRLSVPLPAVPAPVVVCSVALGLLTTAAVVLAGALPPRSPDDDPPLVPTLVEENLSRERAASRFPDHG